MCSERLVILPFTLSGGGISGPRQVWALISGLPLGKREARRLMALQAYSDDSGNEPTSPIFVLAGFVTTHQRWAEFSDEWQAALDEPPKLAYFKMAEAESLRKQFSMKRGWDIQKRDARVLKLATIIPKYAIVRVHASVLHASFKKWIKSIRNPSRNSPQDSPYFILLHSLVQTISILRIRSFNKDPCDLIFDEQGSLGQDAIFYWENLRKNPAASAAKTADLFAGYAENPPIFRDEKALLPLQAADLYAWQLRRKFVEKDRAPTRPALLALEEIVDLGTDWSDDTIRDISQHLVDVRERFIADHPGIRLFGPGEGPRTKPFAKRGRR
jgi:hypothetical protein